jgi:diguanylate cyclase (GGDEF)-like protein
MEDPAFRQSLVELLRSDSLDDDRLTARCEAYRAEGHAAYSALIYVLSHLSFSEAEARAHWKRVIAHRDRLRQRLGRDIGLRVALLDYFVNVNHELKNPKVIEIAIYERTERSAVTDGLTGLYNHSYLLGALRREILRSRRHGAPTSLVMLDLDDFKRVNDTRGHLEGDRVLVKAAALIQGSLREIDIAARYGGEEFAALLPDTPRTGAYVVAERIRTAIEGHFRRRRGGPHVTVSGGVATSPEDAADAEGLIRRADEGLYRAKAAGKNRITLAGAERRRHARVPSTHTILLSATEGRSAAARAKNVSAGGLLLTLKQPVPVGSPVSLVIRAREGEPVGLRGEVVRVQGAKQKRGAYDVAVRLLTDPGKALLVLRGIEKPRVAARA